MVLWMYWYLELARNSRGESKLGQLFRYTVPISSISGKYKYKHTYLDICISHKNKYYHYYRFPQINLSKYNIGCGSIRSTSLSAIISPKCRFGTIEVPVPAKVLSRTSLQCIPPPQAKEGIYSVYVNLGVAYTALDGITYAYYKGISLDCLITSYMMNLFSWFSSSFSFSREYMSWNSSLFG